MATSPEVWLRGPVASIDPLLQPAAHALIQAQEDVAALAPVVPNDILWARRGAAASAGFHLLHLIGALDRLLTYARGEKLNDDQRAALRAEAEPHPELTGTILADRVADAVNRALLDLAMTRTDALLNEVRIGRAGLRTNVLGTVFHAAEHTTRHVGQFITTVKLLQG